MKFPQLAIGDAFSWQGEIYVKTGPIAATHSASGQNRMIPRSALVSPLGAVVAPTPPPAPALIDPARALAALELLHRRCLEIVAPLLPADAETRAELEQALAAALQQARSALQPPGP